MPHRSSLPSLLARARCAVLALALGSLGPAVSVLAQSTYTVTSTADTGDVGTLRWAITQANIDPGSTINIQDNLGTIAFADPAPQITVAMSINGGIGNTVNGGFTKLGGGELILSGTHSFSEALSPDEGTVTITGSVTNAQTTGIAATGGTATLAITGSGANWTSLSDIYIGLNGGTGTLIISEGATAGDTFALVGRHTASDTGRVTVTGAGSTWTHSAGLVIGTGGTGTMLVDDGGHVSNADGTIGGDDGSSGTVTVTGANSLWTSTAYLLVGGNGTGALTVADGGTVKIGAEGAGTLTLANSGPAAGTLNIGAAAGQIAAAPGTVQAATITAGDGSGAKLVNFNHTDTAYTFAPQLTGDLAVQLTAGTTIFTGDNTYTGGTTLAGGTLSIGNGGTTGALAGDIWNGAALVFNRSDSTTWDGFLTGDGSVTKLGVGALSLTGGAISTGLLAVRQGSIVSTASSLNFDTMEVGASAGDDGSFTQQSGSSDMNGATIGRDADSSGTANASGGSWLADNLTVGAGGAGGLTVDGGYVTTHHLVLGRDADSTGTITVTSGALAAYDDLSVGQSGGGTLNLSGGNVQAGTLVVGENVGGVGAVNFSGGSWSTGSGNPVSTVIGSRGDGTFTLGAAAYSASGTWIGRYDGGSGVLTLNTGGHYTETWDLKVGHEGTGILNVNGGTYSGASATNYIGYLGDGTVNLNSGTFDVGGGTVYLGYYAGSRGTLNLGTGTTVGTLTAGEVNGGAGMAVVNFNQTGFVMFGTPMTGSLSVNKLGGGTIYLTGENTYTGGTTISAGVLSIGSGGSTGSLAGDVVNKGTLAFNRSDPMTFTGAISGPGSLSKTGQGTLTLTGSNSYTGTTFLSVGTLALGSANALGTGGTISFASGTLQYNYGITPTDYSSRFSQANYQQVRITNISGQNVTMASGLTSSGGTLTLIGGGFVLTGTNTYTGGTTISSGATVKIGDGGTTGSIAGNVVLNTGTLVFNRSDEITYGGSISGGGTTYSLVKSGAGTLTLTGDNTYTGGTLLAAGTLNLGSAGAIGTSGPVIFSGGTLQYSSANTTDYSSRFITLVNQQFLIDTNGQNVTLASSIASTGGTLAKLGAGALTLSGANTYTGSTSVTTGILLVNGSLANTAVTVATGATLAGTGSIAGSTTIKTGATLAGSLTFSNGLILADGAQLSFSLGSVSDQLRVSGGELDTVSGHIVINLTDAGDFIAGTYTLIDFTGATFANLDASAFSLGTVIDGYTYALSLDGSTLVLTATSTVPEPATAAALAGLGVLALAFASTRRRRSK